MIPLILALAVTATLQPAKPAVGDLIRVEFAQVVKLEPSKDFEIVSQSGNVAVVRTFQPKPFVLSGVTGGVHFTSMIVPVRSVLAQNDPLTPAPLAPPRDVPYPRAPFIAIAVAAACAVATWTLLWWRSRRKAEVAPALVLAPDERFRQAVLALRENPSQKLRWARLADETRTFLAATRPNLRSDLTTSELLPKLRENEWVVVDILRLGDREKFSPWGAEPRNFDELADRALELAS